MTRVVARKEPAAVTPIDRRVGALDWSAIAAHLDGNGWAVLERLVSPDE